MVQEVLLTLGKVKHFLQNLVTLAQVARAEHITQKLIVILIFGLLLPMFIMFQLCASAAVAGAAVVVQLMQLAGAEAPLLILITFQFFQEFSI